MAADSLLPRNDFYVYVHRRATDGAVFYVGKGRGRRARKTIGRNPHWCNVVAKHGFEVEILYTGLTESEAFDREAKLIAHFGRERLCNLTDGGEGTSGWVVPDHIRAALSKRTKGTKRPPEWCAAISSALKGRTISEDAKRKIADKLRGQVLSPETREKMSQARKGIRPSDATRQKMRESWGG